VIFDQPVSRRLTYGDPGAAGLDIAWEGLPQLGVWTKPGAPYLCIEPWHGYADPEAYAGDFRDKPGSFQVSPGDERRFSLSITLDNV
jgi:galactose mutarotase-like enzyme